jgi:hypothetical protein
LDEGEQWGIALQYTDGFSSRMVIPTDSGLAFTSANTAVVTVANPPFGGRLFGKTVGTANVTATYNGASLTFAVDVRAGCWGNANGGWVNVPYTSTKAATVCSDAGFAAAARCGRVCSDAWQPGSDSHFQSNGWGIFLPKVRACGPINPGNIGSPYEKIFCSK